MIDLNRAFAGMSVEAAHRVVWTLPPTLPYFDGHFPGNPVFPAVGIIDASMHALARILGRNVELDAIPVAKFTSVLGPGARVTLTFTDHGGNTWGGRLGAGGRRAVDRHLQHAFADGRVMSEKILARDIQHYIPHRPPMVWIDEVVAYSADGGECLVHLKPGALYLSPRGLRAPSCLEFMAQAYGFCWIAFVTRVKNPGAPPNTRAFLAAFKDAVFAPPDRLARVAAGETLTIKISNRRPLGPIAAFKGQVLHRGDELLRAQMRTFSD